ncbi:MAG: hypothetical protein K2I23_06440, partial [Clostridia bacterium]|nr:hypothetical protein [Clostridia bacterium]
NSQEYTAKNIVFLIKNYSNYKIKGQSGEADVEISIPTRFAGKIDIVGDTITVKDNGKVGTYALLLELTDPINSQWADKAENATDRTTAREVEFTITPKPLSGQIVSGLTDGKIKATENEEVAYVTLEIKNHPSQNDEISIDVYAVRAGTTSEYLMASDIRVKASDKADDIYEYDVELDLTVLPLTGDYIVKFVIDREDKQTVRADNDNYVLNVDDVDLTVSEETDEGNVVWRLRDGKKLVATVRTPIGTLNATHTPTSPLSYDINKTYTFSVDLPTGYSVDTTYDNVDGYVKGYKNASQANANADGETYTTYVRVKDSNGIVETYSITWRIEKAKFDLSKVKWKDDGKYEYTGSEISPSLEGLPTGLEVKDLMGATPKATNVGPHGSVTVQFNIADAYKDNFILPNQSDSDSYDGSFTSWTIVWEIVPVEIKLVWEYKDTVDVNDMPLRVLVLSDSRVSGKVDYKYYETDEVGNIINNNSLSESEIEVSTTVAKYYKALPELQTLYKGNYKFPDGEDLYSYVFSVGGGAMAISLSLTTTEYVYTGKDVVLKWAAGTPTGSLKFTYYEGNATVTEVNGTPRDAGTYTVVVAANNSALELSGETQFTFTISPSEISTEWNTNAKPPVLRNLTSLQLRDGIKYEYYDADSHPVEYSALSAGGTFKIRAVLKDNKNFVFVGDGVGATTSETKEIEFGVSAGENLYDPSDISNPNYNFDDEENPPSGTPSGNDPGSGNNGGGSDTFDEILAKLKELPLWQLIAGIISIILILIFTGKGAGYLSKAKQNRRMAESRYKTYYAGAFLGLATTAWTAIACALMGLAVLSLIFMIIAKGKYNKSLIYSEELRDEY